MARVEITDRAAGPVHDPSYVKALVLRQGGTTLVLATVDAVALGEIGYIDNGYMGRVRGRLQAEMGIPPDHLIVNASHCHSVVRKDVDDLTVQAVKQAAARLRPVKLGAGRGREDRIMENRRLKMKDGTEVDIRRAYSMPPDEDVAGVGPVDPEIGLLRIDNLDGRPLAALYNFACHPIQGVPSGGNTADIPGFASRVIEESFGEGGTAFFIQGCAGDINPAMYKAVSQPHDAEPLGNRLGLSALRGLKAIETRATGGLRIVHETFALPLAADFESRMAAMTNEQTRLVQSLQGTSLNLKTFIPLLIQYRLGGDNPSYYSQGYLHEKGQGRDGLAKLDAANRADLEAYQRNIHTMERLTRLQVNLALLHMHRKQVEARGTRTQEVDVVGVRIGDFVLVTFPGELTVEIGLDIKKRSRLPHTFVAGYSNGYLYYLPTEAQRRNAGYAQEDCDSIVSPEWRRLFDEHVDSVLAKLGAP